MRHTPMIPPLLQFCLASRLVLIAGTVVSLSSGHCVCFVRLQTTFVFSLSQRFLVSRCAERLKNCGIAQICYLLVPILDVSLVLHFWNCWLLFWKLKAGCLLKLSLQTSCLQRQEGDLLTVANVLHTECAVLWHCMRFAWHVPLSIEFLLFLQLVAREHALFLHPRKSTTVWSPSSLFLFLCWELRANELRTLFSANQIFSKFISAFWLKKTLRLVFEAVCTNSDFMNFALELLWSLLRCCSICLAMLLSPRPAAVQMSFIRWDCDMLILPYNCAKTCCQKSQCGWNMANSWSRTRLNCITFRIIDQSASEVCISVYIFLYLFIVRLKGHSGVFFMIPDLPKKF